MGQAEKTGLKKNGFMPNTRSGFSLIQVAITLGLMAVVALVVVPNLSRRMPQYERREFAYTLNTIVRQSWIRALETGREHKVIFNLAQRTVRIEEKMAQLDREGKPVFQAVALGGSGKKYVWPEQFEIKQFFVQAIDEISQHAAEKTIEDIWFFIVPDGMAQEAIINIVDTSDTQDSFDGKEFSLALNPFKVQFELYEMFKAPTSV